MTSISSNRVVYLRRWIVLGVAVVGLSIAANGCGEREAYGEPLSGIDPTAIGDILGSPDLYEGERVRIEGRIAAECSSGCWFNLEQEETTIYVDIKPSGFAIPQRVGSSAVVEGIVQIRDRQIMIVGEGVEIL